MVVHAPTSPRVYEGDGDRFMTRERQDPGERILLVPDSLPSRTPDPKPRIRILWGQHLLEDLSMGRYHSLVCAVNSTDNSHGIISQISSLLPTAGWSERSLTAYASKFDVKDGRVKIVKFDMDIVEVLAILRPAKTKHLTLEHLASAFGIISEMTRRRTTRLPVASVSFLSARANALVDDTGREPAFEKVLRVMYDAGFHGDVYPAPGMWLLPQVGLYPRYPFPESLTKRREGGF